MTPAQEEIAAECERLFQNGGPKVYLLKAGAVSLRPSGWSAARTSALAEDDEAVWARQKVRGVRQYEWRCVKAAKENQQ